MGGNYISVLLGMKQSQLQKFLLLFSKIAGFNWFELAFSCFSASFCSCFSLIERILARVFFILFFYVAGDIFC